MKEIEVIFLFCCLLSLGCREQLSAKMSDCLCKHYHWGKKLFRGFTWKKKNVLNLLNLEELIGNISLATMTLAAVRFILRL